MAITGAIRSISREKIYQKLGLELLESRQWYRKLVMFYKIYKHKSPFYLFNLIPQKASSYATRNVDFFPLIKHNFFKNTFFPSAIIELNYKGTKIMTRLRLGLAYLSEHKFNLNFQNCINPLCSCGMDIESASHFFLQCSLFDDKRITLLRTLNKIVCKLIETNESSLIETLLFGIHYLI